MTECRCYYQCCCESEGDPVAKLDAMKAAVWEFIHEQESYMSDGTQASYQLDRLRDMMERMT